MPRFPTYERQAGLSGGSTASYASDSSFGAPARALGGLGDAVAGVGEQFAAVEQKVRETQDNTWFSKARAQTAVDMIGKERELQTSATDGAKDYTPSVRGTFDEYRKAKIAEAPSKRAASMFQGWSDSYDVDLTRRSATFQAESELAKRTSDFADTMNAHAQAILADPTQYDAVAKRAMDDFEGARQWMTPEQETAARNKVDHDLKLARAKSLVEFSPEDFMRETQGDDTTAGSAIDTVVGKIIGVESGGNPNAKNPNSSATGAGQFISSTWLNMIRKYRPELAEGKSAGEILAMRNNGALSREMTTRYTQENAEFLTNKGIQTTPGNLYLAHFLGPQGAANALRADPGASVASVVGADVVRANPFLAGKSIADLQAWSAKKMGGKGINVVGNPKYEGLSVDELLSLQNSAQTTINANQTTAYNQMKDTIALGIQTGSIMSEGDILGSGLNDGDKASAISRFREVNKDAVAVRDVLEGLANNSLSLDPFDTDARKAVDKTAELVKQRVPQEDYQRHAEEIVRQTGIVPKDVVNEIRKGLQSTNAQDVANAANMASRLSQIDPAALGRRDGGSEAQKAADDFSYMVNDLNMTPEEAGKRIIENNDPEKKRDRKAMEPAAKEFVKEMEDVSIAGEFDTWLGSEPSLGFSPGQEMGIKAEFLAIAEDQFFQTNGDPDLAKNRAIEQMKRLYGVTEMSGSKVVMKYPPERYWPAQNSPGFFGIGADPWQYARTQLFQDITALDPEFQSGSVQFVTTPETDREIKAGKLPGYAVLWKDKNGVLQTMPGKLWRPDPTNVLKIDAINAEKEQAETIERARQDDIDDKMGKDREGNLDRSLYGNPLTGGLDGNLKTTAGR
jgi:hypothetical protein